MNPSTKGLNPPLRPCRQASDYLRTKYPPPRDCSVGTPFRFFLGRAALGAVALLVGGFVSSAAKAAIPDSERQGLVDLYNATNGPSWANNTGWLGEPGTECVWYGITCNEDGSHVKQIALSKNRMSGQLSSLAAFSAAESIIIRGSRASSQNITGPIPDLSALVALKVLNLNYNQLTGPIPDLSGLHSIETLSFERNQLSGPVPDLSSLTALTSFNAAVNRPVGQATGGLSGELPSADKLPPSLQSLLLSTNSLEGCVPDYSSRQNLSILYIDSNFLRCHLPPASFIAYLAEFWAGNNAFYGTIPDPFAGGAIATYSVGNDPLTVSGDTYNVSSNELEGPLPDFADRYPLLRRFHAYSNFLTGSLPSLSGLTNIAWFDVHNNKLSGSVPSLLGLSELNLFAASFNQLSGSIPDLSSNQRLEVLLLNNNNLTGSIPNFKNNTGIIKVDLSYNKIGGEIPSLAHLSMLSSYSVESNQLTGQAPPLVGMGLLYKFTAKNNLLSGSPPPIGNNENLQTVDFSHNQMNGAIPPFVGVAGMWLYDVSNNHLTGGFPDLSNAPNLEALLIGNNNLTGQIPSLSHSALVGIFMQNNQFSGPIPSLESMPQLRQIWMHGNALTGVPPAVTPYFSKNAGTNISTLCPGNDMDYVANELWDTATRSTPWYKDCADGLIFRSGFEFPWSFSGYPPFP